MPNHDSDSEPHETHSEATTHGVHVVVRARYSKEQSDPQRSSWFFLYTIRISNEGDETVQLVSRHWEITDATGHVEVVDGPGVVGEQPRLEPGQSFEYTSGCPLNTPFGSMQGTFQMVDAREQNFDAKVARFELREPTAVH